MKMSIGKHKNSARNRDRTGTAFNCRGILSPLCLPIPPSWRHMRFTITCIPIFVNNPMHGCCGCAIITAAFARRTPYKKLDSSKIRLYTFICKTNTYYLIHFQEDSNEKNGIAVSSCNFNRKHGGICYRCAGCRRFGKKI